MPNEIKMNKVSSVGRRGLVSRERQLSNDSITVFVWSMGGLVFAACSDGGPSSVYTLKQVEFGTSGYENAKAYLDANLDGVIDSENQIGTTDSAGVLHLSPYYANSRVLINLEGARHIATGEVVTGSSAGLLIIEALPGDYGRDGFVLLSPLTDMLAEGERAGLGTPQAQLDAIFGSGRVSERDVMNIANYFGGRDSASGEEIIGSDITDSVIHQAVSRAALALGALRSDPLLTSGTATSEYEKLRHLFEAFRNEPEEAIGGANLNRYILRLSDGDLANEVVRLVFDNPFTGDPLGTLSEDGSPNIATGHIEFDANSVIRFSSHGTPETTMTGTSAAPDGRFGDLILTRVGEDGITASVIGGRINWSYTLNTGPAQALRFDETYLETINILIGPDANNLEAGVIIIYIVGANDPLTAGTPIPQQSATQDMEFTLQIEDENFNDADANDPRRYTVSDDPAKALPTWLELSEDGLFSGTPEAGDVLASGAPPTTIYFMAHDSGGSSLEASFELTIANVNDPPVVNELIADLDEMTMRTVTQGEAFNLVVSEDAFTDPDLRTNHDTLVWSAQLVNSGGTTTDIPTATGGGYMGWLLFDPTTRTFSGTPDNDHAREGNLQVRVTVTDTGMETASQDFTIVVVDINDPPVPRPANVTLMSGTQGQAYSDTIPLNAFDDEEPNNLVWSAQIVNSDMTTTDIPNGPTEGYTHGLFFNPGTRELSGMPTNDAVGTLNLRITANDDMNSASLDTTLTIANVNDLPIIAFPRTDEYVGGALVYAASASIFMLDLGDYITDPDSIHGQTLTFAEVGDSAPDWLGDLSAGVFSGTVTDMVGNYDVTISVTDGAIATPIEHTFRIIVHGPPTITPPGTLNAVDENDQGAVTIGTITFTDDRINPTEFTNDIVVRDSNGISPYFRLTDFTSTGALSATATLEKMAGVALDYEMGGTQTIEIHALDGEGGRAMQNVTIMVGDVNEAPVVNATGFGDRTLNVTSSVQNINLTNLFTDPDDPTMVHGMLTITATVDGSAVTDASTPIGFDATANSGGGALVIAADATAGIYRIVLTATDGDTTAPLTATHSFLLALNDAGSAVAAPFSSTTGNLIPPAFSGTPYSHTIPLAAFTAMGEGFSLDVLQADGNPLPQWLSFDETTRMLEGMPPANSEAGGALELVLEATEETSGAKSYQFFTLNLFDNNTAPTLEGDVSGTVAAGTATGELRFGDGETENLLLAITEAGTASTYGAFTVVRDNNAGTLVWTYNLTATDPDYRALEADEAGSDETFDITVNDGVNMQDSAPTTITVTGIVGINDAPEDGADEVDGDMVDFTAGIDNTYTIPATAFMDVDGDDLTFSVSALPAGVTWNAATRTLSGRPEAAGTSGIIVTASDGTLSDTQTITLVIAPPPVTQGSTIDDRTYVTEREYTIVMTAVSAFDTTNIGSVAVVYTAQLSLNGGTDWETIGTNTHGWSFDSATNTISTTRMEEMDSELPATAHQVRFLATPANGEPVPSDAVVVTFDINDTPTVGNDITIPTAFNGVTGWNFRILAAAFRDADTVDSITAGTLTVSAEYDSGGGTYVAVLNDDSHWLNYAADTRTFSGMPDTIGEVVTIRLTATDPSMASVSRNISFTVAADVQKGADITDPTIITGRLWEFFIPSDAFSGSGVGDATFGAQLSTNGGVDWDDIEINTAGTTANTWYFDPNDDVAEVGRLYITRNDTTVPDPAHQIRFTASAGGSTPIESDEFTVTFNPNDPPTDLTLTTRPILNPAVGDTTFTYTIDPTTLFSDADGDTIANGGLKYWDVVIAEREGGAPLIFLIRESVEQTYDFWLDFETTIDSVTGLVTATTISSDTAVIDHDFTLHISAQDLSGQTIGTNTDIRPIAALPTTGDTIDDQTFITSRTNSFYMPANAFGTLDEGVPVTAQLSTDGGGPSGTWTNIEINTAGTTAGTWYFNPDAADPDDSTSVGRLYYNNGSVPAGTQMIRFVATPGGGDPVYSDEFTVNIEANVGPEDETDGGTMQSNRPVYNPAIGDTDWEVTLDLATLFSDANNDPLEYRGIVITEREGSESFIHILTDGAAQNYDFWLAFSVTDGIGTISSRSAVIDHDFTVHVVVRDPSHEAAAANINIRPVSMPEKGTAVDVTGHKFITGREDEFFVPNDAFMNRGNAVLSAQVWNGTDDWDDITTNDGTANVWNFDPDTGRLYSNRAETSNTDFMFRFGATPPGGTPVYTDAFTLPVEVNQGPQAANGMIIPMPMVGDAHGDWTFKIPDVGEVNAWFTDANGDNFADGTLNILRVVEVYGGGAPFERELVDDRPLFRLDTPGANVPTPTWLAFDKASRTLSIIDGQKVPAYNFLFHVVVQDDSGTVMNQVTFTFSAGVNIPLRPQLVLREGETIDAQKFVTARVDEFYIPADAFIGRGSETLSAQVSTDGTDWDTINVVVDAAGTTAGTWYFDPDAVNPDNPNEIGRLYSNRNETSNTNFMIRFGATPTGEQPVYTDEFTLTVDVNGRPGDGTLNMGTAFTQNPTIGSTTFAYEIPANAFNDPDGDNFADGTLTYHTVVIADREGLTSGQNITIVQNGVAVANHGFWLSFDPTTGIASTTSAVEDKYFTLHVVGRDLSGELRGANIPIVPEAAPTSSADPTKTRDIPDINIPTGTAIAPINLYTHFQDADDDTLTFTLSGNPAWLSVNANGELVGTPDARGTHTVTISVDDDDSATAPVTDEFVITVTPATPVYDTASPITDVTAMTNMAITAINLNTHFSDADTSKLSYFLSGNPDWLELTGTDLNMLTGTPDVAGSHTVTVIASDGVRTARGTFDITTTMASPPPPNNRQGYIEFDEPIDDPLDNPLTPPDQDVI